VGELLAALRQGGLYEDSVIIITSDHGENLGDHGHFDHVFSLYNSTLRVPLLVRLPRGQRAGTVRTDPVQLVDIFPTIAAIVGFDAGRVAGRDLLGPPSPSERPILAAYDYPMQALAVFPATERESPALDRFRRRLRSIQIGSSKFIWGSDGRNELYDLADDPAEGRNRVAADPEAARRLDAALQQAIRKWKNAPPGPGQIPTPDAATQERLGALGYR